MERSAIRGRACHWESLFPHSASLHAGYEAYAVEIITLARVCQLRHLPPLARFAAALGAADFSAGFLPGILAGGFAAFAGSFIGFADFPALALAGSGASGFVDLGALVFAAFSLVGLSVCAVLAAGFSALARLGGRRPLPLPIRSARAASKDSASSSVIVSGVLSLGSVALTPSWLT